mmetsp:Transcript_113048/g.314643  ORF Transcript_113048/g.314643 Transcript_113048/m.314643 type:complete len:245 (-) Transcript_113048:41-775(-)
MRERLTSSLAYDFLHLLLRRDPVHKNDCIAGWVRCCGTLRTEGSIRAKLSAPQTQRHLGDHGSSGAVPPHVDVQTSSRIRHDVGRAVLGLYVLVELPVVRALAFAKACVRGRFIDEDPCHAPAGKVPVNRCFHICPGAFAVLRVHITNCLHQRFPIEQRNHRLPYRKKWLGSIALIVIAIAWIEDSNCLYGGVGHGIIHGAILAHVRPFVQWHHQVHAPRSKQHAGHSHHWSSNTPHCARRRLN